MHQAFFPILALALVAAPTRAQDADSPPPEQSEAESQDQAPRRPDARLFPLLSDTSLDEQMLQRTTRPAGGISVSPTQYPSIVQVVPNQPVDITRLDLADGSAAWTEEGTLRPEGTFLVGWIGEIVLLRTGGLAFLPATKEGRKPEPAMALLPCNVYSRIAGVLNGDQRGLWLNLTGEILEYHGRNYLLPTTFAGAEAPAETDYPSDPVETPAEGDQPENPSPDQPAPPADRIDELVRQLETDRAERRGISTAFDAAAGGAETGTPPPGPRLDGRMLLSQRGRMVRSAEGGWVVAIDNDGGAEGPGLPHRLRLLPCRVVGQMEQQAEVLGESWSFEVSGHLYRLGASVYLLPRMYVSLAGEEVRPLQ